jgi:hypothetical protein
VCVSVGLGRYLAVWILDLIDRKEWRTCLSTSRRNSCEEGTYLYVLLGRAIIWRSPDNARQCSSSGCLSAGCGLAVIIELLLPPMVPNNGGRARTNRTSEQ